MEKYKRNLVDDYRDLLQKVESLRKTLNNGDKLKEASGEEAYEFAKKRLVAMEAYLDILSEQIKTFEPVGCDNACINESPNKKFIDRKVILGQAIDNCLREMYRKSQPSGDYDEYVRQLQEGEIKEEPGNEIYRRHYLSQEEFQYIVDKYVEAYGMHDKWDDNFELLVEYLGKDPCKEVRGDDGDKHLVNLGTLKSKIKEALKDEFFDGEDLEKFSSKVMDIVLGRIEECRTYYRHGMEESSFRFAIALSYGSPTSNKEEVKKYWAKQGANIEIVEHNPDDFWGKDYYGEEE